MSKKPWAMPGWMVPYRPFFVNTGGLAIEDLMNSKATVFTNVPRVILNEAVRSQVALLEELHKRGLL